MSNNTKPPRMKTSTRSIHTHMRAAVAQTNSRELASILEVVVILLSSTLDMLASFHNRTLDMLSITGMGKGTIWEWFVGELPCQCPKP
eukprot:2554545-Amphidinium_carterae.1